MQNNQLWQYQSQWPSRYILAVLIGQWGQPGGENILPLWCQHTCQYTYHIQSVQVFLFDGRCPNTLTTLNPSRSIFVIGRHPSTITTLNPSRFSFVVADIPAHLPHSIRPGLRLSRSTRTSEKSCLQVFGVQLVHNRPQLTCFSSDPKAADGHYNTSVQLRNFQNLKRAIW